MSAATVPETALSPEVRSFLQRHRAEAAFDKVCELVRECYPDRLDLTFRLLDDPDTDDRQWLVIGVVYPTSYSLDMARRQDDAYRRRLVTEVPLEYCPLFAVSSHFVGA